jgi:putative DNA primase/helicase
MTTSQTQNIRDLRQWVCWRSEERDGKTAKIPYSPLTGRRASSTDPESWGGYPEAVRACRERGYDGIGFTFTKDDPFCGVDIDRCLNAATGEIEPWAREIIEELDSYTEISPSGTGVHILLSAVLPEGRNRKGRIEMYDRKRYFTITGRHLEGTPHKIEAREERLLALGRKVMGELPSANGHISPRPEIGNELSDQEIIGRAAEADNGEKFRRLWTGDTSGYASASEADQALCSLLAFWTGPEADRIDSLFRQSGLYRDKWDREDYRNRTISKALEGRTEFYRSQRTATLKAKEKNPGDAWEEPTPLPEGLPPVNKLDPAMLPGPLRRWILDISERMQIPPDFAAIGAVTVAGSLIGRKIGIYPKRYDDWLVVPNLWGAVVGRPSLLKSPALAEVMKPLSRLIAKAYERHEEDLKSYEAEALAAEAMKAAFKDEVKQAAKESRKAGNRSKLDEAVAKHRNVEPPEEPTVRRYKTEDATVEKISELLLQNPEGILVHRDELSGWFRNLGKQGREGDRAFYLESWNGSGSFDVDRIGRGSLHIPALCLSILGGIQPGPLSSYVWASTQGKEGDDGLLQRFQLLVWPDTRKEWRNVDRWPDAEAKSRAYEVFDGLDALTAQEFGAIAEEDDTPAVRFTPEAQEAFDEWRDELETMLRDEELIPALEAHLAKYRSLMPSLALLFELVDFADGTGEGGEVGLEATLRAAAWCEYLRTHAERLYSSAQNPAMEAARALLERIRKGGVKNGSTVREVYRKQWAKLSSPEAVNAAAQVLEAFGWLRVEENKTGGRSTKRVHLYPNLRAER